MNLPELPHSLEELAGASRAQPPCIHFGTCGGCSFQHVPLSVLHEWKRNEVRRALASHGIENVDVRETIAVPPRSRRRVEFAVHRTPAGTALGFMALNSHAIVEISECHVADPTIVAALPALRALPLPAGEFDIAVLFTQSGLDIAISSAKPLELSGAQREALARAAKPFTRLSVNGETIAEFRKPIVDIAGVEISPPPAAFLQPTMEGERALQRFVVEALSGAKRVADLFAGCGTFALALAKSASVHAVDGAQDHLAALAQAARHSLGLKPITMERRDLFRRPLMGEELARFDAVVLDPPRAGARAQSEVLAASRIGRIVYVSCNPAAFARDAKILANGGYKLTTVVPVDQFLWSPHIELVARFTR